MRTDVDAMLEESFPKQERYIDCAGQIRIFELYVDRIITPGYLLAAREITEGDCCYKFRVFAEVDPFAGFGRLRAKIRRGLSRRYLIRDHDRISMSHDDLSGTISSQGIVVDGQIISWDEFQELLLTHEGFRIELHICEGDE
ncbi:DUF7686 domain-containing protein [Thiocystis violacea]|uniref:DUF7686 domain-containing protein n=1 Tax=Thiocystis violacea TaxID=13725 RepID=UPI001904DBAD|nr:hypothetical protein [Thiocystis violacea]